MDSSVLQNILETLDIANIVLSLVSLLAGFALSVIWWYLLNKRWVPKLEYSPEIAKFELPSKKHIWMCVLCNSSKRKIFDVEITCRVAIVGYEGTEDTAFHSWKTNASKVPALEVGRSRKVRIYDQREIVEFYDVPSKAIRDAIERCQTLDEVLGLGTDSYIKVYLSGIDELSGSRKVIQSHRYYGKDIRRGTFKGLDVVQQQKSWP